MPTSECIDATPLIPAHAGIQFGQRVVKAWNTNPRLSTPRRALQRLDSRVRGNERWRDGVEGPTSRDPTGRNQVTPTRVQFLDKLQLPFAPPFLQLPFAAKGGLSRLMDLEPDEGFHIMSCSESRQEATPMLPHPSREIVGHADVQRAVPSAAEYIDVESHGPLSHCSNRVPMTTAYRSTEPGEEP